ncbi:MAG: ybhL [Myxococcales bacterium]|nr:ybhL [Myxococcales bacterium]
MLPENAPSSSSRHAGTFTEAQIAAEQAGFMRKVFAIMGAGLVATAVTSLVVVSSDSALRFIFGGGGTVFYGLLIAELVMVWTFVPLARRMSAISAGALFFAYAILNGVTLSVIFFRYTQGSIASTFFVTAGTFGAMSAYGYITKRDLTSVGNFMIMALFGLIMASVVNMFLHSPALYWGVTFVGVLVFVGLTAYDTQKIKEMNVIGNAGTDEDHKEAIHGALVLYLDFINLFLFMLRLLGRRR